MLTTEELHQAKNYLARSIAEGRTTIIGRPLTPEQYAALPDEDEPVNLLGTFRELVGKFHATRPDPFTAGQLDEWLFSIGIHSSRQTVSIYLLRGVRAGWLLSAGNKPTGYRENLYQLAPIVGHEVTSASPL